MRYTLTARGIRKISSKNAGSIQPFMHARFYIDYGEQRTMHTLRTADTLHSYRKLREDLRKQTIASVFCECIEKAEAQLGLWTFFHTMLTDLEEGDQDYLAAALFFAHMNRELGIEPFVDGCANCGRSDRLCAVSIKQGGLVCQNCYQPQSDFLYERADLKSFRILCKARSEHYPLLASLQQWQYEHFLMVYRFFAEYSGIRIRSVRFLSSIEELSQPK